MDSAELLDLLGNENRRRILRLLAKKPCYVTEISEYLGVSPKAVIDHLRRLDEAGLVETRVDDQRRKYYFISQNLRLEVSVSPYAFGTKSAYPASQSLDVGSCCHHLTIDIRAGNTTDLRELAAELRRLEQLQNELSMAQRWVQGRLTDVMDRISDEVGDEETRLYAEIIRTLSDGPAVAQRIAEGIDVPTAVVRDALETLADRGVVVKDDRGWRLPE